MKNYRKVDGSKIKYVAVVDGVKKTTVGEVKNWRFAWKGGQK